MSEVKGADMNELIHITNQNGQAVVSSLEVAERFNKEHKNIIRDIRAIQEGGLKNELSSMFYETEYTSVQNKKLPMYLMNRDGFSLLAMGFTGKEALAWKVKYIEAFNKMEETIRSGKTLPNADDEVKQIRAAAMKMNAETRRFKATVTAMKDFGISQVAGEAFAFWTLCPRPDVA